MIPFHPPQRVPMLLSTFTNRSRRTHGTLFQVAASQLGKRPKRKGRSDIIAALVFRVRPTDSNVRFRKADFEFRVLSYSRIRIPKSAIRNSSGGLTAFLIANLFHH